MEPDSQLRHAPDRRIALLIDVDSVSHAMIAAILAELPKYGTANVRRAYEDWASTGLMGFKTAIRLLCRAALSSSIATESAGAR